MIPLKKPTRIDLQLNLYQHYSITLLFSASNNQQRLRRSYREQRQLDYCPKTTEDRISLHLISNIFFNYFLSPSYSCLCLSLSFVSITAQSKRHFLPTTLNNAHIRSLIVQFLSRLVSGDLICVDICLFTNVYILIPSLEMFNRGVRRHC